jgi:hypothetical protein
MTSQNTKQFAEYAKQAEASVANIADADLKKIAFGKILETLLAGGSGGQGSVPAARAVTTKAEAKNRSGPRAYIEELLSEGFFAQQRTMSEVRVALGNRGFHIPLTSLSGPLQSLCKKKILRREKTKVGEKKQTFAYSKW